MGAKLVMESVKAPYALAEWALHAYRLASRLELDMEPHVLLAQHPLLTFMFWVAEEEKGTMALQ